MTPEQFAELLCDDLDLPTGTFGPAIAASIKQQVEQFSSDMIPDDEEDRRVIIKVCEAAQLSKIWFLIVCSSCTLLLLLSFCS